MASHKDWKDALTEMLNIGSGRAAHALSNLAGHPVEFAVPKVHAAATPRFREHLAQRGKDGFSVTVPLDGGLRGGVSLFVDRQSAAGLYRAILSDGRGGFHTTQTEVLVEVASIVLNALVGTLGELASSHVTFRVPQAHRITSGDEFIRLVEVSGAGASIWAETTFDVPVIPATAWVVLHAGVPDVAALNRTLDQWAPVGLDTATADVFSKKHPMEINEKLRPIMLADDEADDEYLLRGRLREGGSGRDVVSFKDGADLVDFLQTQAAEKRPIGGLLLLDLKMPRMDGFEALSWIRSQPALSGLNVVVVTSSERQEDAQRALSLGARRVMLKFPSVEELVETTEAFA